jgi:hypothetical protein
MSVISEALGAIREALKLADDVKRTGETLKELSKEVRAEFRDQDRRITRLEAQWQTALDLPLICAAGRAGLKATEPAKGR